MLDQLLTLIADTEAGIAAADAAAEAARQAFLDPIQTPDVNARRARVEAVEFTADRLRSLLPRLQDRYRDLAAADARAEWQVRFEALQAERDKLAEELRATYSPAVTRIADVLGRVADLDRRLSQLHGSRPSGAKGQLLGAELVACNLTDFTRDEPSITRELKLPSWTESNRLIWPPPTTPASVMVAGSVAAVHDPRRYSADWREAPREETDRRVAEEEKRIADEAARVTEDKAVYERSLPR